jgi:hypothetical protein
MRGALVVIGIALALISTPAAFAAQTIRGRVIDERTRQAISGAVVTLLSRDSAVVTRAEAGWDGFFTFEVSGPGAWIIAVTSAGRAESRRTIEVADKDMVVPAFVLDSQPIALDTVAVDVDRREVTERAVVGFARASHVVTGERLASLERQGIRFASAMRDLGAGLHIREWVDRDGSPRLCIESNRRLPSFSNRGDGGCDWVAIVIDGVPIGGEESTTRTLSLDTFESIEFFTPVEAGSRFGMRASATGALVLWTRGRGPHVSEARNKR